MDDGFLVNGPKKAAITLVLAHGAGAPMDTPFMNTIAEGVAAAGADVAGGITVVRFEFPYMAARRISGKRGGAPDRPPVLIQTWRDVIAELRNPKSGNPSSLVIGGKSMGGRIATMVADDAQIAGIVSLGYPFHPPNNSARTRVAHLEKLRTPALFLQGTRDTFGLPEEIATYKLSSKIQVVPVPDGDHSFKPRVSSGHTEAQNLAFAIAEIRTFIAALALAV